MKTTIKILLPLAVLGLLAASLSCEDTDVVAPLDGIVDLTVNPSTIRIDPDVDSPRPEDLRFEKSATVRAFLFDANNLPQGGVTMTFSTVGGGTVSPVAAETRGDGSVETTLTVTDLDEGEVTVRATSGLVTGEIGVPVTVEGVNELPRALVGFKPNNDENLNLIPDGPIGVDIIFDGTGSSDPDGQITCYQWEIESNNPDANKPNPILVQGIAASGLSNQFNNEQTLSVTLRVSDVDMQAVGQVCDQAAPFVPEQFFSPIAFRSQYELLCNNPPPVAIIAGGDTINATGSASTLTSITLDGSLSFDNETAIDRYVWSCGNEIPPTIVAPDGSKVTCRYRLGTFTATLNVVDKGTGVINPATGTFECQKSSEADTVTINITTP